jgi:hypothetical protein
MSNGLTSAAEGVGTSPPASPETAHRSLAARDHARALAEAASRPDRATRATQRAAGCRDVRLFVIDGIYDREGDGRQVFEATLDDAGTLSPLVAMATLLGSPRIR